MRISKFDPRHPLGIANNVLRSFSRPQIQIARCSFEMDCVNRAGVDSIQESPDAVNKYINKYIYVNEILWRYVSKGMKNNICPNKIILISSSHHLPLCAWDWMIAGEVKNSSPTSCGKKYTQLLFLTAKHLKISDAFESWNPPRCLTGRCCSCFCSWLVVVPWFSCCAFLLF